MILPAQAPARVGPVKIFTSIMTHANLLIHSLLMALSLTRTQRRVLAIDQSSCLVISILLFQNVKDGILHPFGLSNQLLTEQPQPARAGRSKRFYKYELNLFRFDVFPVCARGVRLPWGGCERSLEGHGSVFSVRWRPSFKRSSKTFVITKFILFTSFH
jgi:hypothetical protein